MVVLISILVLVVFTGMVMAAEETPLEKFFSGCLVVWSVFTIIVCGWWILGAL